jgi:hypothetical protein
MKLEQVYHGKFDENQAGSLGSYLHMTKFNTHGWLSVVFQMHLVKRTFEDSPMNLSS